METVIVTTEAVIKKRMEKVLDKKLPQPPEASVEKTYSINQVARMMGRSHKKISNLVAAGVLKATADNRIFESSIKEYNNKQSQLLNKKFNIQISFSSTTRESKVTLPRWGVTL